MSSKNANVTGLHLFEKDGEIMIFILCTHVETFLHKIQLDPEECLGYSFLDRVVKLSALL